MRNLSFESPEMSLYVTLISTQIIVLDSTNNQNGEREREENKTPN